MLKDFYRREMHHAARFCVGMSAADVEALCVELNQGRDATGDMVAFNGSAILIIGPHRTSPLICEPGNWIVVRPDQSLDVRSHADFCGSYCPATA
jgi:hypothetical protein